MLVQKLAGKDAGAAYLQITQRISRPPHHRTCGSASGGSWQSRRSASIGLCEPKANPTLREARVLLLARKKQAEQELDEDMRRGLGGMSLSVSVNEDVKKILQGDVNRRVALQLGQTIEAAREAQAKKIAVHNQAETSDGARRSDKSGT